MRELKNEIQKKNKQLNARNQLEASLGIEKRKIRKGTFTMGCTPDQGRDCQLNEDPKHSVTLERSFEMMKTEVSQGLYKKVSHAEPSHFKDCAQCPVDSVSWHDAVVFANTLNKILGLETCYVLNDSDVYWPSGFDCSGWRLPTEAEWEFAARAKTRSLYAGGSLILDVSWSVEDSNENTHPGCLKNENAFGLCDMSGNVWEWCWDRYAMYSESNGLQGPLSGDTRVLRGGSWKNIPRAHRVSHRAANLASLSWAFRR